MKEVNLPESVTCIGNNAFWGCENLKEIKVSESNKTYRSIDGILYTKDLKRIICHPQGKENEKFVIPTGVTSIGDEAFWGCENLKEINIPTGVTSIGDGAFSGCYYLKEINISTGVTSIGNEAFSGCYYLKEVNLPESVTCIGAHAFSECEDLEDINIPTGTLEKFKELLPEWTDKLHEV